LSSYAIPEIEVGAGFAAPAPAPAAGDGILGWGYHHAIAGFEMTEANGVGQSRHQKEPPAAELVTF
jgi:hypothetical protein